MKGAIAGIDIGGTKVRWVIMRGGRVVVAREIPTPQHASAFGNTMTEIFKALRRRGVRRAGVSIAGTVKHDVLLSSHNLPMLRRVRFAKFAPKDMIVHAKNDAQCFALAEAHYGRARRYSPVLAVTIGTGIGRAFIKNGQVRDQVRFERAEYWEGLYQKRSKGPARPLATFLGPKVADIAVHIGARAIVLGGGRLRTPGLFTALRKNIRHHIRVPVYRSYFHQNSASVGAALLVK